MRCARTTDAAARLCRGIVHPLLDFLYPPRCLGCGGVIDAADVLCASCLRGMIRFPFDDATSRMHLASLTVPVDASLMYVGYEYERESALEACIHEMKYRGFTRIAEWMGRLLGERCAGTAMLSDEPLLAPVPLHRIKRIERGYNQSEWICRGIAKETGLQHARDLLRRERYTDSQSASRLDTSRRRMNMLNAFAPGPDAAALLPGRSVILVDDVITTGATVSECVTVLRESGARDVRLLAIARPCTEEKRRPLP